MTIRVFSGKHGLFYGTDTTDSSVFVAAKTETLARRLVEEARSGLLEGTIVLPQAEDQTPEQRLETVTLFKRHLCRDKH